MKTRGRKGTRSEHVQHERLRRRRETICLGHDAPIITGQGMNDVSGDLGVKPRTTVTTEKTHVGPDTMNERTAEERLHNLDKKRPASSLTMEPESKRDLRVEPAP